MPLIDITNPAVIKFLVESYDKTAKLRMRWNTLHERRLREAAQFRGGEKGYTDKDVMKNDMVAGMVAIKRDNISSASNKLTRPKSDVDGVLGIKSMKKGHSIVDMGLGDPEEDPRLARPDDDLSIDPRMRPVNPKHKKIIYKDKPEFGRECYLKVRSKMDPDKKYYYDDCSSWVYGWRLGDSAFGKHAPSFGRVKMLTRDGMSRSGPQPDPAHYKSAVLSGAVKCSYD